MTMGPIGQSILTARVEVISSTVLRPFCIAPWVNLHVDTLEQVKPCCNGAGIREQVSNISFYAAGKNTHLENLKTDLRQGIQPASCQGCQEYDWYSEFSDRCHTVDSNPNLELQSLDLRWSNTCQLNCLYCSSAFSSAWASLESNDGPPQKARIAEREHLMDLIDRNKKSIKRISLLGGEPLLIKDNLLVLDKLDPEVRVDIFTGFNMDLEHNPVFQRLIDMPNVQWSISMENVGQRFEFVRRNAVWSRQLENLKKLVDRSRSQFTPTFQSQFCAYSATCVVDLYRLAADLGFKIHWSWLGDPRELDFSGFPDELKMLALEQFEQIKSFSHVDDHVPVTEPITNQIQASMGQGDWNAVTRCIEWHRDREKKYFNDRWDFLSLWTEFSHMP